MQHCDETLCRPLVSCVSVALTHLPPLALFDDDGAPFATLTTVMSAISVMRLHAIENREAVVAETLEAEEEQARELKWKGASS